jgi:hypothetical protein
VGARAGSGWEVHQQPNGVCDVRLDGRIVQHDCDDLDDAVQLISTRPAFRSGERRITVVETDGYRYGLTR